MKNAQVSIDALNRTLPTVSPVDFPKILEENVGNFCPACGKTIFSNLLEINGKVYLEKNCCTEELVFMENDVDFFKKHKNHSEVKPLTSEAKNYLQRVSANPNYGTSVSYVHINSACNQNCPICYEQYSCQKKEPSIKEVKEELKRYNSREIALIGGEPTIREDLFEIVKAVKKSGNIPAIVTNGLKLEDKNYIQKLKKAGLGSLHLSFDGFNQAANIKLRGQDLLEKKLKVLKNIEEVGGPKEVSLVPVIHKELNGSELSKIIQFALKNKVINKIVFIGLTPPPSWNDTATTCSDLIKIMEKEGYFTREYFLELVKMYRNIYEITRKIFKGTPLESWFFKRLPGIFNVVHFKKGTTSPQLLFKEEDVAKTNQILARAINQKSRTASFCVLLKSSRELLKPPLTTLLKKKLFILKRKESSSDQLLQVSFHQLKGKKNTLLGEARAVTLSAWIMLLSGPLSKVGDPGQTPT